MVSYRGVLSGLAISFVSSMLTMAGLEAALRLGVFSPAGFRSTRLDTHLSASPHVPDFRKPGFELQEKGSAFRIVVVGDSFAWGDGVHPEDSFPSRLETRLAAMSKGAAFEVINWSRPGWNTVRQARSLESVLADLDPDLLLLGFVLNDPDPEDLSRLKALLAAAGRRQPAAGPSSWLIQHSRLYSTVWTRLENNRQRRELRAYYHNLYQGEHWQACQRALKRMRKLTRKRGIPMVVVILPVFDGPMDDSYPYADLHKEVRVAAESLGIPVLDLLETFRGIDGRRLASIPYSNAHPSELAHRLAADSILDHLVRGGLLPPVNREPNRGKQAKQR